MSIKRRVGDPLPHTRFAGNRSPKGVWGKGSANPQPERLTTCPGPAAFDPRRPPTRREFLLRAGSGFGMLALGVMLAQEEARAGGAPVPLTNPLAPKMRLHPAKGKSVIFLFMSGGPSHLELFDPKPELQRLHGEKLPPSFGPVKTRR